MLYYNAMLALLVLGVLAVMVLLSLGMAPVIRRRIDRQFLAGARNQAFVTEHVAGIDTVKSLQMEPQLARRFGSQLSDYLTAGFATGRAHNAYNTAMHALEQTLSLGVLVLGAWIVMQDEGFTIGMLVAFQMFASRVAQPMLRLAGLWQEFQQAGVAVRRLADLMDAPVEPVSVRAERAPSETARIDVDGLCFRPPGRAAELFHGVSFTVAPGECVAISGASGSGKSTLARLLQGIYAPDAGSIRLNGHDLRTLPVNELRAAIGVVPQDTVLFSGSLYENLVLGQGDIELDQVVQACMLAGIHDVVQALPDGYQTAVGEHGAGLSGGQRQRIAVARALLRRPRLLIFDEATSQLDAASAAAVIGAVNQLRGRSTIVFIAHEVPAGLRVDHELRLGAPGTV
jgi:subfamily B ATP-binding cassette protein HlyB/CyaB